MDDESPKSSCWSKRTKLEKYLLPALVLLILIVIGLLAGLIVVILKKDNPTSSSKSSVKNETAKTENVCSTPGCIEAASSLLKTMDMSVDPCKDFYQFSCGNFLKTSKIEDDRYSVATSTLEEKLLHENMQSAIESPIQKNEPKTFQLVRSLYKGCMNTELIEKESLVTIQTVLKELGGWPVLEGNNWHETDFEWTKTVTKLKNAGCSYNFFITIEITADPWHSMKHIIGLRPAATRVLYPLLFKDLKNTTNKEYRLMVDVAEALEADKVQAEKEMLDTFNFFSTLRLLLNGLLSLGENIADNGGAKAMYLAYRKWAERNGNEAALPGLPYNAHQLLWISSAVHNCEKSRKDFLKDQLEHDGHLPASFRTNIPFSNNEYFAKEFNCSVGSPMNPKKKCKLW